MVCWVCLSGAEGCFLWLDIDGNWHRAMGSFALCGAGAPTEVLLPLLSTGEQRLWLSGELARCMGLFARGIKIARGWLLVRQKP